MSIFTHYYKDPEFKARHQAYMRTYVHCVCGCTVRRSSMTNHKKSDKHFAWIANGCKRPKKPSEIRVRCKCGCVVLKSGLRAHKETKKHRRLLKKKNKK